MKKLFLAACLVILSASTFASSNVHPTVNLVRTTKKISLNLAIEAQPPIRTTYVSSCGATWSLVSYSGAIGIILLQAACDQACGSNDTLIVLSY